MLGALVGAAGGTPGHLVRLLLLRGLHLLLHQDRRLGALQGEPRSRVVSDCKTPNIFLYKLIHLS